MGTIRSKPVGRRRSEKGVTLVELLVAIDILVVLMGAASFALAGFETESRCFEIYQVLPQIIRSQALYYMQHSQYYTAGPEEFKNRGVDVSELKYFSYSTFPSGLSSFSVKAEATEWLPGAWVIYNHRGDPTWTCDGLLITRDLLPQ